MTSLQALEAAPTVSPVTLSPVMNEQKSDEAKPPAVMPTAQPAESFAVRTAWLATARFLSLVFSVLLPFMLVRKLSTAEFGLYKQAFNLLQTGLSLLGLQITGGIYSFIPRYPTRKAQVAMNAVLFYVLVGGLVALWFACYPGWIVYALHDNGLVPVLPLIGLAILLWLIAGVFESVMIADNDVRRASVISVALQSVKTVLLVAAALWRGDTYTMVSAAVIFGLLHCAVFFVYLYRRYGTFWWPLDLALLREQLANALPFGIGAFVFSWQYDLHNYFVARYYGPTGSAMYATGAFLLPLLLVVLDAFDTIMMPEIARLQQQGDYRRIAHTWLRAIRTLAFCFLPACALFFVLREELIVGLYTENFRAAVPIFAVSLLNTLLLINLTGSVMRPFDELKHFRTQLYLALMPLTVILLYTGSRLAGLLGVMVAMVIVRGLDVGLTVRKLAQRIGMQRSDWHALQPIWRIALAAGLAALLLAWLKPWLVLALTSIWSVRAATFGLLIVGGVCFSAFYLPLALWCGAVGEQEREIFARLQQWWQTKRAR